MTTPSGSSSPRQVSQPTQRAPVHTPIPSPLREQSQGARGTSTAPTSGHRHFSGAFSDTRSSPADHCGFHSVELPTPRRSLGPVAAALAIAQDTRGTPLSRASSHPEPEQLRRGSLGSLIFSTPEQPAHDNTPLLATPTGLFQSPQQPAPAAPCPSITSPQLGPAAESVYTGGGRPPGGRRRQAERAVRFLRGICCEKDEDYAARREQWAERRQQTEKARAVAAAAASVWDGSSTAMHSLPSPLAAMSPTGERGLLLGEASRAPRGAQGGAEAADDALADPATAGSGLQRYRRKHHKHRSLGAWDRLWDEDRERLLQGVVQPLFLTMGGVPVAACTFVQTFETKAEKAARHRDEKKRRDQDALGLLSPFGGHHSALDSIRRSLATKAQTARAKRSAGQSRFYAELLKPSGNVRRISPHNQGVAPKNAALPPSAVIALSDDDEEMAGAEGVVGQIMARKKKQTGASNSGTEEDIGEDDSSGSALGTEEGKASMQPASGDDDLVGNVTSNEPEDECGKGSDPDEDYDPFLLDDPEIKSEKRRKQIHLMSLRATIIPYSKRDDLKKDVNQQFFHAHPWIEAQGVTLTGIRKAKLIMINLALEEKSPCVQASTVAYAVVYFEKLILKRVVTKENRKLVAAVCLVLAFKFWEATVGEQERGELRRLLEKLEEHFEVDRKRVLRAEFELYARLEFEMLVPRNQARPHFQRLLALYSISTKEYLQRKDDCWGLQLHEEGTAPVVRQPV